MDASASWGKKSNICHKAHVGKTMLCTMYNCVHKTRLTILTVIFFFLCYEHHALSFGTSFLPWTCIMYVITIDKCVCTNKANIWTCMMICLGCVCEWNFTNLTIILRILIHYFCAYFLYFVHLCSCAVICFYLLLVKFSY